jgi:hypothetical protein
MTEIVALALSARSDEQFQLEFVPLVNSEAEVFSSPVLAEGQRPTAGAQRAGQ